MVSRSGTVVGPLARIQAAGDHAAIKAAWQLEAYC
jgi:hypothetical protein